jgi:hypothetical protein
LRAVDSLRSIRRAARRIFIAVCVIAAGSCATISNNTTPPPGARVVEAPDYSKQGGTWRYRVEHKMFGDGYRSDMDYGDTEIEIRNGQYRRYKLEGGKRVPPSQRGTWLYPALASTRVIAAETQYYNFPFWVGKAWKGRQWLAHWDYYDCTVTGMEKITTPAGTFETFRIEREMKALAGEWNYYDTEIYYYSPETRSIVKYDYKREFKDLVGDPKYGLQETAGFELLSYKPEPQPKDAKSAKAE